MKRLRHDFPPRKRDTCRKVEKRDERARGGGNRVRRARKGVKTTFWGVFAEEVDPGANRQPPNAKITDPARCNENSLRLVTRPDSRIKFTTDARLYFQTGWSSRTHLKAPPRIFLRSKAPSWRRWRVCATNDSTRSKDADFRQEAGECI